MLQIVAQTIEATIFARATFNSAEKGRTHFAYQRFGRIDLWEAMFDFFVRKAVPEVGDQVHRKGGKIKKNVCRCIGKSKNVVTNMNKIRLCLF